jgi:glucokinase
MTTFAVGIDIGGTRIRAAVVAEGGAVLERVVLDTPHLSQDPRVVEDTLVDAVERLGASYDVAAVGVAAAGWVDRRGELVVFAPHLSWRNEPLAARLRERLATHVVVDNDANVSAMAEMALGAGRGSRDILLLTLGTGIGGAYVHDGSLVRGANGLAGEFGHMQVVPDGRRCECGNRGCWEQYSSGSALVREARELVMGRSPASTTLRSLVGDDAARLTGPLVTEAARAGDRSAVELLAEVGEWLGTGIAGLCAALDPELVIVGGGVSEAGDLLLDPARRVLARKLPGRGYRPEPAIVQAALGAEAAMIGAGLLATRSL